MFTRQGNNGTSRTGVWVSVGMTFHARFSGKALEEPEFFGTRSRENVSIFAWLSQLDPSPTLNTVRTKPRTLGPASSSSRQLREPPHSFVTFSSPLLVGGGRTLGIKRCRTQS